ncbi:MAG TPA: type VI secretion system baseplate subunit TssG [Gammaproteobacteria bacterium]|nr:type VI secretion system baseplate subunit TssG [Gammaproteobacteria bacterium]
MGTVTRRQVPALIQAFLDDAPDFQFFQAVRLLENHWHGHGRIGQGLDQWLRLRPAAELGFPASDIRRCRFVEDGQLDLQLNFMGLYGVDGILPGYFLEFLARDDETSAALRHFIDFLGHRFYALYYLAWKKYRPYVTLEQDDQYLAWVNALSGNVFGEDDAEEYAFSGALGNRNRGAAGLEGMLADFLGGIPVTVEQFVPRWVRVETGGRLGGEGEAAMALGDNTLLGDAILDLNSKIGIHVGPLPARRARELLPGHERARALGRLLGRYLEPGMAFDVVLHVQPDQATAIGLGSDEMVLGWSTWLGDALQESYALCIPGSSFAVTEPAPPPDPERDELAMVA